MGAAYRESRQHWLSSTVCSRARGYANRSINKSTTRSCSVNVQIAWNTPPSYPRLFTFGHIQLGSEPNSHVVDDAFMSSVSECAGPAGRETHYVFTNQRTCNSVKKHRVPTSVVSRAIQNYRTTPPPNKTPSLVFSNLNHTSLLSKLLNINEY